MVGRKSLNSKDRDGQSVSSFLCSSFGTTISLGRKMTEGDSKSKVLSKYANSLGAEAKRRYLEKIDLLDGYDPFLGVPFGAKSVVPPVDASDLLSYLVVETSFITAKQFKARKSLEAYNQFVSGWVKEVKSFVRGPWHVTSSRVRHSQRFSDTPLKSWIISSAAGEVCCAHCDCMAGLGETCTHVAATLFYLEAAARMDERLSCTSQTCQWVIPMPRFQREMEYSEVCKIDFASASGKRKRLDADSTKPSASGKPGQSVAKAVRPPSAAEKNSFFAAISNCEGRPAVLSLIKPYSKNYVPARTSSCLPPPLPTLFKESNLQVDSLEKLSERCKSVEVSLTSVEVTQVEKATREQSLSKIWFEQRAGRITASKMHDVMKTSLTSPSVSLIKSICYPEVFRFSSKATDWGCSHEKIALQQYVTSQTPHHESLKVSVSGLVLNQKWPFLGASPDGIVDCSCCGRGVIEIKCPYGHREKTISAALEDRHFCLESVEGSISLKHTHSYYYQVQAQLHLCGAEFCDFCICLFNSSKVDDFFLQRILPDSGVWEICLEKATKFFYEVILLELSGKWFTSNSFRLKERSLSSAGALSSVDHDQRCDC